VRNLRLFHKSQVRPMTAEEKAQGSASKLPPVSEPPKAKAEAVPISGGTQTH
jgi:hypothetical protein